MAFQQKLPNAGIRPPTRAPLPVLKEGSRYMRDANIVTLFKNKGDCSERKITEAYHC